MKYFVTGGAGFIGSCLVDRVIGKNDVTVYDNFSSGKEEFISYHFGKKNFKLVKADLLDLERVVKEMNGHDTVWHLAANPDIRKGTESTRYDLEQNTLVTFNVLEAAKEKRHQ